MGISTTRDTSARIRILKCEPEPTPQPTRRWPLAVSAVVVAGLGVGLTLALRPDTPPPFTPVAKPAQPKVVVEPVGTVNAASFRHTPSIHRALRSATSADLSRAARVAREAEVVAIPVVTSRPVPRVETRWVASPEVMVSQQRSSTPQSAPAARVTVVDAGDGAASPPIGPDQPGSPTSPDNP